MDLLVANNEFLIGSLTIWKRKLKNKITKFEKLSNLYVGTAKRLKKPLCGTVLWEAFQKANYELEKKIQ